LPGTKKLTRVRTTILTLAATGVVALACTATPASAGLGILCPDANSQVFRPWGDLAFYAFTPNGGFEYSSYGWTLSGGAKVVDGNESFFVHSRYDDSSLLLPAGSRATTPPMCIGLLSSKMRLFLSQNGDDSARLKVQVLYGGGLASILGGVGQLLGVSDVGYLSAGDDWQASDAVPMLGGTVPLLTQYVQFRFTPVGSGDFQIDDVYLDPLMHG
jgi:hypothetical protein